MDRKDVDGATNNDANMQYDDQMAPGLQDETAKSGGNGTSTRMDIDEVDRGNDGHNNDRDKINPFSNRNRNNYNSGNDSSSYGFRDSPAVIVNTNLLPFIQKLRDPLRELWSIKKMFRFFLKFLYKLCLFQHSLLCYRYLHDCTIFWMTTLTVS